MAHSWQDIYVAVDGRLQRQVAAGNLEWTLANGMLKRKVPVGYKVRVQYDVDGRLKRVAV